MAISAKQALVIGNDAYVINSLESCVNDATDLSNSLRSIGFRVQTATDLGLNSMQSSIHHFVQSIRPGSIVLFYFSGHGLQYDGHNYLISTNDNDIKQNNIKTSAFNVQNLITDMHKKNPRLILCILDCCRSYWALESSDKKSLLDGSSTGMRTGLAAMQAPPSTIIAYACAAEATASANSKNGRNSAYTYHLLRHIETPNVDIETVLKNVAIDVQRATKNQQIPFRYSSCNENIYLVVNPWQNVAACPIGRPIFRPGVNQHRKEHPGGNFEPPINNFQHRSNNHRLALPNVMRPPLGPGFPLMRQPYYRWP